MAQLTSSVEYGLHSLLWLAGREATPISTRDLADFQGISHSLLAKIFPKLERAGIVRASEGASGGYVLSRSPKDVTFLEVVDAIEGRKRLFACRDIRGRCAVFGNSRPAWATGGTCSIHAVMLRAEKAMRDTLAQQSLADLAQTVAGKAPSDFGAEVDEWLGARAKARRSKRRMEKSIEGSER